MNNCVKSGIMQQQVWGSRANLRAFVRSLRHYVGLRKYERFLVRHALHGFKVSHCSWLTAHKPCDATIDGSCADLPDEMRDDDAAGTSARAAAAAAEGRDLDEDEDEDEDEGCYFWSQDLAAEPLVPESDDVDMEREAGGGSAARARAGGLQQGAGGRVAEGSSARHAPVPGGGGGRRQGREPRACDEAAARTRCEGGKQAGTGSKQVATGGKQASTERKQAGTEAGKGSQQAGPAFHSTRAPAAGESSRARAGAAAGEKAGVAGTAGRCGRREGGRKGLRQEGVGGVGSGGEETRARGARRGAKAWVGRGEAIAATEKVGGGFRVWGSGCGV